MHCGYERAVSAVAEFQLKADPGTLRSTAGEVRSLTQALRADFDGLHACVRQTARYWLGPAGDQYRREFAAEKADTDQILALLGKYPEDLLDMAGLYEAAEDQIAQNSAALPSDIL